MDFEVDLGHEVGYVSNGQRSLCCRICRTSPGTVTTKHAFAFLASSRKLFQAISSVLFPGCGPLNSACHIVVLRNHTQLRLSWSVQDLDVRPDNVLQVVSDGLNDGGLSVTVQWDYDVPGFPNSTTCNTSVGHSSSDTALPHDTFCT